ncbi:MAG: RNA helicase, partial [Spirochaetaceae bacterium]|nr:RNA helicase [Spirochaetaceae bacterium]
RLLGGGAFFALDSGIASSGESSLQSPGECAILLRAAALAAPIEKALKDHGIPCHLIGEDPWRSLDAADAYAAGVRVDAVNILTIHAAKGLEFDHVFVAALEEGILPFTLYTGGEAEDESTRVEEEKRLLYVAMTRARKGLYLSWARKRTFRGRKLESGPSRFLAAVEAAVPLTEDGLPKREKDPHRWLF